MRVGIVDDHPAIVAAIAAAVDAEPDLELAGTAAVAGRRHRPGAGADVLVCDVQLDGQAEGLQLLEAIHRDASADPPS